MVTKKMLEEYRSGRKEIRELRAQMRQAELSAMESGRESDRRRAMEIAARYDALADVREEELREIDMAIDDLTNADQRRAVRMMYVEGKGKQEICARLGMSERTLYYAIKKAIKEMGG